jgi:diguanylate cyclase (GGDEF)-like protein
MLCREASSVLYKQWSSELIGLLTEGDVDAKCPIEQMNATNAVARGRYRIRNLNGKELTVNLRAIPLFNDAQLRVGGMLIIRDSSKQANLEQTVETLHAIATRDPLTKVANREELSRRLPEFVDRHLAENCPGSVIMCDIDYFKKINDTYGHQAGDDALVTFAGILSEIARDEDLVARYGGEEFVIICDGCDNGTATKRAEQIRLAVQQTPVPSLGGSTMTSSFGVTEIQAGDTQDTILARVDRALMTAKETGRNRVVQLGSGQSMKPSAATMPKIQPPPMDKSNSWLGWFSGSKREPLVSAEYLASVPKEVAIQKLEGFINDHRAQLVSTEPESVVVRVDPNPTYFRRGERASAMLLQVKITAVQIRCGNGARSDYQNRTKFDASVIAYRARDRRSDSLIGQANQLLQSFQSYLVAQPVDDELRAQIIEPR